MPGTAVMPGTVRMPGMAAMPGMGQSRRSTSGCHRNKIELVPERKIGLEWLRYQRNVMVKKGNSSSLR
jgi:hypothetical protein